jgi:hypothetical protein
VSDDNILRERARNLILAGIFPARPPDRMWGGWGGADREVKCIVCSSPVKQGEVRLEIEYELDSGAGRSNHQVHVRCYSALESERRQLQLARRRIPPAPRPGANLNKPSGSSLKGNADSSAEDL